MSGLAEKAIATAIINRKVRTAIIRSSDAFEELYESLRDAMTRAWNDQMREGIAAALDRMRDLDADTFTRADGERIMRVLETSVGVDAIRGAMRGPVINLTDALFRTGAQEVGTAAGVDIAFMRPDLDALDILQTGNLYWVGNCWNTYTQDLLTAALDEYFREGMTREQLTARFASDFASLTERGQRYWELLADHTATKTREMGRVTGYERAAIRRVQVRAHIDENTTEICRKMHGRVIEVTDLSDQRSRYLDAAKRRDEPSMKEAWPMYSGAAPSRLPNTGPPYHFRCRTITVMYIEERPAQAAPEAWRRAELPQVPAKNRAEVEGWITENIAEVTKFNSTISGKNAARYAAAVGQTREHFDLGKLTVLASGSLLTKKGRGALAFYMPGRKAMGVNASVFKQDLPNREYQRTAPGSKLDLDKVTFRWFAAEPTVEYIARHEYGHWFHDTYRREVDTAMADALKEDTGWPAMVSRYGTTNKSEWFAEMFALYFEGADQHFRIPSSILKVLKEKDRLNDV